jgi:uncharacterized protein (DUF697 family)
MKFDNDQVPCWVRSLICIVGCSGIIGLLAVSVFGGTVPAVLVLGVTFFAVWTASLAFGVDTAAMRALTRLFRRWTL